jgi:hypothetical protein
VASNPRPIPLQSPRRRSTIPNGSDRSYGIARPRGVEGLPQRVAVGRLCDDPLAGPPTMRRPRSAETIGLNPWKSPISQTLHRAWQECKSPDETRTSRRQGSRAMAHPIYRVKRGLGIHSHRAAVEWFILPVLPILVKRLTPGTSRGGHRFGEARSLKREILGPEPLDKSGRSTIFVAEAVCPVTSRWVSK